MKLIRRELGAVNGTRDRHLGRARRVNLRRTARALLALAIGSNLRLKITVADRHLIPTSFDEKCHLLTLAESDLGRVLVVARLHIDNCVGVVRANNDGKLELVVLRRLDKDICEGAAVVAIRARDEVDCTADTRRTVHTELDLQVKVLRKLRIRPLLDPAVRIVLANITRLVPLLHELRRADFAIGNLELRNIRLQLTKTGLQLGDRLLCVYKRILCIDDTRNQGSLLCCSAHSASPWVFFFPIKPSQTGNQGSYPWDESMPSTVSINSSRHSYRAR